MSKRAEHFYEFGRFRLDPAQRLLLRDGELVPLTPKVFDLLMLLVENNGQLVGKDELMSTIWPDAFVEESSLTKNISILRKMLGEDPDSPARIETLSKRGYRLVGDISRAANAGDELVVRRRRMRARIVTTEEIEDDALGGSIEVAALKATSAEVRSLAVLPFRMLGQEQADEYLRLGLADVLITQLSNTGEIVVRPTSAVLKYADARPDSVGAGLELGVDAVVEGSVQRDGVRLRVTVQMIGVRDGVALWADKFNTEFTDIFAVQDAISEQVARALTLKLTSKNRERLRKRYTESTEAYHSYLKGRYFWNKRNIEGFKKAIEHFKAAIEVDPTFALAFAGLSDTYVPLASWGEQPREALSRARAAAEQALEIDDSLCEAHASLGNVLFGLWDLGGAEVALKRAIELNPNYATAHNRYAQVLVSLRRFDEAIAAVGRAQQLDPLSAMINTAVGAPYFYARQYERAVEQYRKVLELDPDFVPALFSIGSALSQQGFFEEAIVAARKAVGLTDGHPLIVAHLANMYAAAGRRDEALQELGGLLSDGRGVLPYTLALVYARLGECDRAMGYLEEAFEQHNTHLHDLNIDPEFDPLRSDPRFMALVERVGLTP
ncbi:MAG: hypothetical protein QOC61_930 [Acidobacteriota bacterium]|nr:hypothetical protein [Acidobacteriota bacterium]